MAGVVAGEGGKAYCGLGLMGLHRRCRADAEGEAIRDPQARQQRVGKDSRTPSGRLLGQLQPVDGEAVDAATHTARLSFALHVTVRFAHIGCLDFVAAVALGAELQPSIQVTPGGRGWGEAAVRQGDSTRETPGDRRHGDQGGRRMGDFRTGTNGWRAGMEEEWGCAYSTR